MDAVRGPSARNTKPNSAPYTTGSCFAFIGAHRKRPDHRMTSYNRALEINEGGSVQTTLRTRRFLGPGTLIRTSGGRLPKRLVFGNLEGDAARRGRGGKEKEWIDRSRTERRSGRLA